MIRSFSDKETLTVYEKGKSSKYKAILAVALRKLDYLNAARTLDDLKVPPGNRLEKLKGKYSGKYSIRINDQYRIVFSFADGDAFYVKIEDYH